MAEEKPKQVPPLQHATEHLANERTFLAWVRTAIAVISLGFAVTKFDAWLNELAVQASAQTRGIGWSEPMGVAMIVFGGLLPVFAAWRYHIVNRQIKRGEVRADRVMVALVTSVVVILAIVFVLYLLKSGGRL